MALLEWIKDAFGIIDDAGDFYERLSKITERRDRILKFIIKESQDLERRIDKVEDLKDLDFVVKYVRTITDSSKDLEDLLVNDLREVKRLQSKASRFNFRDVEDALSNTRGSLEKTLAQHGKFIRTIDQVSDAYRAARRATIIKTAVKTILGAVVSIAASVALYKILNTKASARFASLDRAVPNLDVILRNLGKQGMMRDEALEWVRNAISQPGGLNNIPRHLLRP